MEDAEPVNARHGVGDVERDGEQRTQRERMVAAEPGGEGTRLHVYSMTMYVSPSCSTIAKTWTMLG